MPVLSCDKTVVHMSYSMIHFDNFINVWITYNLCSKLSWMYCDAVTCYCLCHCKGMLCVIWKNMPVLNTSLKKSSDSNDSSDTSMIMIMMIITTTAIHHVRNMIKSESIK
jgi:hypothetical protein